LAITLFKRSVLMKMIRNIFIMLLILSLLNFYLPRVAFSQVGGIEEEITKHAPEMRSTPEENIPVEVVKERRAIWVLLGLLVIGGTLALVTTGGGGNGTGNSSGGNSGNIAVGW
jgi:hypothetical protein